jgi:superfamily II DNA or RNA helicase
MVDQTGKVKIVIQCGAHVFNASRELLQKVRQDLKFKNPKYENAKKYGLWVGPSVSDTLKYFSYRSEENIIYIPRGYIFYLIRYLKQEGIEYEYSDRTTLKNQINLEFKGKLRDYQEDAIKGITRYPGGILESGTGSGKTTMGLYMITVRKQPTLIIVHSKELLYQWQERIKQFLGYDCGLVGDGKTVIKDITVGIIQSVKNNMDDLKDRFGHVICDEVHRSPATTWTSVLDRISAKYLLGLSATAYRNDGLGSVMNAFIGPKIHVVDKTILQENKSVLKPKIVKINTGFYAFYESYTKLISDIVNDKSRNKLIVRTALEYFKQANRQFLIVSDRVSHCVEIADQLEAAGITVAVLSSDVPKGERQDIVQDVNKGRIKALIATTQLISEGFDAPNLHALFITTPIKYKGKLVQVVGRILRPEEGKTAVLFDFRDDSVKMLQRMGLERDKTYRREKWV